MPIISKVESKSWRGRATYAVLFLVLSLGGLTMLYPFVIMIGGSMRSTMDQSDLRPVPDYLVERDALYRKFLETKYNGDILDLNAAHGRNNVKFETAGVPPRVVPRAVEDLARFLAESNLPRHWQVLGGISSGAGSKIPPPGHRALQDRVKDRFAGDLDAFGRVAGTPLVSWTRVGINVPDWMSQRYDYPAESPVFAEYFTLADEAAWPNRQIVSLTGHFLDQIVYPVYGKIDASVRKFNDAHPAGPRLSSFAEFIVPQTVPPGEQAEFRAEWIEYVFKDLNPSFLVVMSTATSAYPAFLKAQYERIDELNQAWRTNYASFDAVAQPDGTRWLHGAEGRDYLEFVATQPPERWRLVGPEFAWRDWLARRYDGSVDALNAAHETSYASLAAAAMPVDQLELRYVEQNEGSLRWEHATRNYAAVWRELVTQGRPFWNTLLVCAATVVLTLLVNPMAAYAMSRFQLPGTYKILLLLMVTAAFPPMVVMVPKFLILRETGLLNTYAALIVPFLANGYLIFLLKGFFDSLPTTLYEAALIDGAGEARMFFEITLALSKPILAVVALQAFNSAYTMFLYALIVCPHPDMWTLNVWLYQWQSNAPMPGVFAALLISAVPTLLMFLVAQNVIMRGIVVPVEK